MAGSRRLDKKRERYNLNIDPEVMHEARVEAARQRMSISEFAEVALAEHIAKLQKQSEEAADG